MTAAERRSILASMAPEVEATYRALPECGDDMSLDRITMITGMDEARTLAHLRHLAGVGLVRQPVFARTTAREKIGGSA